MMSLELFLLMMFVGICFAVQDSALLSESNKNSDFQPTAVDRKFGATNAFRTENASGTANVSSERSQMYDDVDEEDYDFASQLYDEAETDLENQRQRSNQIEQAKSFQLRKIKPPKRNKKKKAKLGGKKARTTELPDQTAFSYGPPEIENGANLEKESFYEKDQKSDKKEELIAFNPNGTLTKETRQFSEEVDNAKDIKQDLLDSATPTAKDTATIQEAETEIVTSVIEDFPTEVPLETINSKYKQKQTGKQKQPKTERKQNKKGKGKTRITETRNTNTKGEEIRNTLALVERSGNHGPEKERIKIVGRNQIRKKESEKIVYSVN